METLSVRAKDKVDVRRKPRVYFSCHPADLDYALLWVSEKMFATHDCAIYYTQDMSAQLPEETRGTDLERMNLFVIPVTRKLLTEPNRTMSEDLPFALKRHIPVLPIMMEPELVDLYSREGSFGALQFLDPNDTDVTALSFDEKLKKHLDATLTSNDTARQIREDFDAYLFLSYRKKDRSHANELMRLVHKDPSFRDVAIWYDEFLTPGEDFRESIETALRESRLFMLLVTPNLLEEPGGKPNFVMAEEYPAAHDAGMGILPVEMLATNQSVLKVKFVDIPACAKPSDEATLHARLLEGLGDVELQAKADSPDHTYLMGLAYLDGIDMEVDRKRALELIKAAANVKQLDAMRKLRDMYQEGMGVNRDYEEGIRLQRDIVRECERRFGAGDHITLNERYRLAIDLDEMGASGEAVQILNELIEIYKNKAPFGAGFWLDRLMAMTALCGCYHNLGEYEKSVEVGEESYQLHLAIRGKEHPDTLNVMNNLAISYDLCGDHEKSLSLHEEVYKLRCDILGEDNALTLGSLDEMALSLQALGHPDRALPLFRKAYENSCKTVGEEDPVSIAVLSNLAGCYGEVGMTTEATEANEKVYRLARKSLGKRHPQTMRAMSNLASDLMKRQKYTEANELYQQAYDLRREVLGENHPDTLRTLQYLGISYTMLGEPENGFGLGREAYEALRRVQGESHPDTLAAHTLLSQLTNNTYDMFFSQSPHDEQIEELRKAWSLLKDEKGESNPKTLKALDRLAEEYGRKGKLRRELDLREQSYELWRDVRGDEAPETMAALTALASICDELGDYSRAMLLQEREYNLKRRLHGDEDPDTIEALIDLAFTCGELGNYEREHQLLSEAYGLQVEVLGSDDRDTLDTLRELRELEHEHPEVVGRDEDDELDYDFDDDGDLENEDDAEPEPKRGFGASLKRLFGR